MTFSKFDIIGSHGSCWKGTGMPCSLCLLQGGGSPFSVKLLLPILSFVCVIFHPCVLHSFGCTNCCGVSSNFWSVIGFEFCIRWSLMLTGSWNLGCCSFNCSSKLFMPLGLDLSSPLWCFIGTFS